MSDVKVKCISYPRFPIETLYCIWTASREPSFTLSPEEAFADKTYRAAAEELFDKIIYDKIPIAENLYFTFILDHVSISLREQMVRHRVGMKHGPSLGVDIVPDLTDSTWWSQSMRVLDMGSFAHTDGYHIPESIRSDGDAQWRYLKAMSDAENAYNELVEIGIPLEDARQVIPLAATHRISWTLNLAAIQHVIGKRGCWILQLGLWKPVILGIVDELCRVVSPGMRQLISPPCMKGEKYTGCHFVEDNVRRHDGRDPLPVCTLYEANEMQVKDDEAVENPPERRKMMREYGKLWNRDVHTGEWIHHGDDKVEDGTTTITYSTPSEILPGGSNGVDSGGTNG